MDRTEVIEHRYTLEMRRGMLVRSLRFRDGQGRITAVSQRLLVHHDDPHVAALETTFRPEGWSGTIEVWSAIDGTVGNQGVPRYEGLGRRHLAIEHAGVDDAVVTLVVETNDSRIRVAEAARTRSTAATSVRGEVDGDVVGHRLTIAVRDGGEARVEKVLAVHTGRDRGLYEPAEAARRRAVSAPGFDELVTGSARSWAHAWHRTGIEVEEHEDLTRGLTLNLYHLHQAVSKHTADLDVGIPARGLTGEGYRGHIFWDELFVFPFVNLRLPELARSLLLYRYRRLGEARRLAQEAGFEGAMFPWQSAGSGREETPTLHLNPASGHWLPDHSHLQRHVNAAIARNVVRYFDATGDQDFIAFTGAELVVELARFWASATTYDHIDDRYGIRHVLGPDEFHDGYPDADEPGIHDNAYTNVMAAWVLWQAGALLDRLDDHRREEIVAKLEVTGAERQRWDEISRKLRVCFHDGVISQFAGYEELEELDWDRYRDRYGDIRRLDRILEAEGDSPNRYRLSKQADTLMLFYLFTPDQATALFERLGYELDRATIDRTIRYYLDRTSHGSTLSRLVHAWVLAHIDPDASFEQLCAALRADLDDGGTTAEGVHLGAMAGTVDMIERGYAGITFQDGTLCFDPVLPDGLGPFSLSVRFLGNWLDLRVAPGRLRIRAHPENRPVRIRLEGQVNLLEPGRELVGTFGPGPSRAEVV
jgi:trehalose/maltose hydrolase-like predicted phosphorylase